MLHREVLVVEFRGGIPKKLHAVFVRFALKINKFYGQYLQLGTILCLDIGAVLPGCIEWRTAINNGWMVCR